MQSSSARQLHKRKHSLDPALEELAVPSETSTDGTNTQLGSNSISSESASRDAHVSQTEELPREGDLAATVIQSAFRAFLVCYIFEQRCVKQCISSCTLFATRKQCNHSYSECAHIHVSVIYLTKPGDCQPIQRSSGYIHY